MATVGFAALSVAFHALVLTALVVATSSEAAPPAEVDEGDITYVDIRRFAPPPPPGPSAPEPAPQPEPRPTRPEPTPTPEPRPAPEPELPPRPADIIEPVDSLPDPLGEDVPPDSLLPPAVEPVRAGGRATGSEETGSQLSAE